jgi:hypothetical protein
MKIMTCVGYSDDDLERYRPSTGAANWEFVISGFWSSSPMHSGYICYYIQKISPNAWVMNSLVRNGCLDGVTQEDIDEGCVNDDQLQALFGKTLEEAQNYSHEEIAAVLIDAPIDLSIKDAAIQMYEAIEAANGRTVDEPDDFGLTY